MQKFFKEKRWVMWKYEKVNGRLTKVPYTTTGRHADSTDEKTWTTHDKAIAALTLPKNSFSGIGIVFTPAMTLLGIDLDHVLTKETETLKKEFAREINHILFEADTFTEISPSGEGLHLYLALETPLELVAKKHAPYEVYTSGRFFTFTEKSYYKEQRPVRTISTTDALAILKLMGYPWGKAATPAPTPSSESNITTVFTDKEVVERMFASKWGEKIKALYDGDISSYAKDESRADAALLSHFAFWTRKDRAQMERLWLASPLGRREKTQKRQDYRTRSIDNAVANCKEIYTPSTDPIAGLDLLFTMNEKKDKVYTQNTENMCRILRKHPDFLERLRFDSFVNHIEIKDFKTNEWRELEDADIITIQTFISILFGAFRKVGKDMIADAVVKVAKEYSFDSAIDFIQSIKWDGNERLDTWLGDTYGTPNDLYHRSVAANWIKGLVKRIVEPGCKFDYVLVLEGEQGSKKSTSLYVLGTISSRMNWHVETTMSTDSKDFFEQFLGKAIIEFSEGETLSRTEVKKMKAIITTQVDRFRPSYGRLSVDHPRRCVFAMTTNQDQYLKDETGNRRWLPVTVRLPEANVEWLAENRDQLFAEAYYRLTEKKETIYEFPREETRREQELRRVTDPNEERICHWYMNELKEVARGDGITIEQVNQGALHQGFYDPMKKHEEMAIADVLARVLRLTKKRKMVGGVQAWRWFPPESVMSGSLDLITQEDEKSV